MEAENILPWQNVKWLFLEAEKKYFTMVKC